MASRIMIVIAIMVIAAGSIFYLHNERLWKNDQYEKRLTGNATWGFNFTDPKDQTKIDVYIHKGQRKFIVQTVGILVTAFGLSAIVLRKRKE